MKNTKDIVKYDNSFNLTSLNELDCIEQDILFTFCSQLTKNKSMKAKMTFEELREKAFLTERNVTWNKSIVKLRSLGQKIIDLKFIYDSSNRFKILPLFDEFSAEGTAEDEWHDNDFICVSLNPKFAKFLYDIPEKIGFSLFELQAFLSLKSKYAKTLFRFFLQNFSGKWIISVKDLHEILGFSESYTAGNIVKYIKKVLPEIEETGYFSNIEMDYTTKNVQGRPIKDVIFSYKLNEEKALESKGQMRLNYEPVIETKEKLTTSVVSDPSGLPHIETKTEKYTEEKKCPKCGSKVVKRRVSDEKKESFGKLYEKCEKNDSRNQECDYFKWIDK